TADPWRAVPSHAAVVLRVPDAWSAWDRFSHTSQLWGAFEKVPSVAAAGKLLARTAARMEQDATLRDAFLGTPVLVTILRGGGDAIGCTFTGLMPSGEHAPLLAMTELLGADAAAAKSLSQGGTIQVRPDTALPALS